MAQNVVVSYLETLTNSRKNIFLIGFFFAFFITLKEFLGLSYNNFQIFSYGSIDFWEGINPYNDWDHLSLRGRQLDVFLYGPLFSILFTPFAYLPDWIGVFCWNTFTYTLFFFSIFNLPEKFTFDNKRFIFFISALLLFSTLLSVQFNPVVAALYLFSFTLLEKNKGFWAVFLILISGFIKVYGIFQLIMLICYPKFWKNVLFAILIGLFLLLLPLIQISPDNLIEYYQSWVLKVMDHANITRFYSFYRPIYPLIKSIESFAGFISVGILLFIFLMTLLKLEYFKKSFINRARLMGVIMGWSILFGLGSERHTYVIAMVGYAIWYIFSSRTTFEKVLLWGNFLILCIMPIDILCPVVISDLLLTRLNLNVIVFSITWFLMVYRTFNFTTQDINNQRH